jgi:hypothetical protein
MSVTLTPFADGDLCHGSSWAVEDEGLLARHIARIAVGQSRHVERILAGAVLGPLPTLAASAAGAIEMLTVVGDDPSHRDGWMFQAMSWVAAHRATPGGIIRAPHMILADKGFDGLQLELDAQGESVTAAIIFEDKATDNPRAMIRDKVWPEFASLEAGGQAHVLTAEVISLLRTQPGIDPDAAIANVIWMQARHYRVSITVGDGHADVAGRQRLFLGYDGIAPGAAVRRRGEIFVVQNLRPWMAQLAARSILAVTDLVAAHV